MKQRDSNIILVGILLGILLAGLSLLIFEQEMIRVKFVGDFFLSALKMLVVPLVVASLIVGVTNLGDIRKLRRTGLLTLLYYAITTAIAVAIGIVVVLTIQPGVGVSTEGLVTPESVAAKSEMGWVDILMSFVSENIMKSLAEMEILPIIVFTLLFAAILSTKGEKARPVIAFFEGVNDVMMTLVRLIMWLAPVGVFGLVAARFAQFPPEQWGAQLAIIGKYMLTVIAGLAFHGFVVLPILCFVLGRRNPLSYFFQMFPALLTAWSTASSSATLPLTMECCEERAGVRKKSARFVLPIGATVNMDGTALYESVAAIFIAQAFGVDLTFTQIILIFITATLAAIGAAGIPEAGLFTMVLVLKAVGLPLEGIALIIVVDWFLDRFRTAINVWGDSVGAAFIHQITGDDDAPAEEPAA